jgi:hypothetical protein
MGLLERLSSEGAENLAFESRLIFPFNVAVVGGTTGG